MTDSSFPSLVPTGWLAAHLDDPALRIFDCSVTFLPTPTGMRMAAGRAIWAEGHVPGAGLIDIAGELSDPDSSMSLMMPPAEQFAEAMGRAGVGPGTRVVLYDTGMNIWATRVWWMLRAMGFDDAAVLDGGFRQWISEGRPLSEEECVYPTTAFEAHPRAGVFVDKQAVQQALGDPGVCLINALPEHDHAGMVSRGGRAGHIPGSVNVPTGSLIDPASATYLPLEALREKFRAVGALDARQVICYCAGGITATTDAFHLVRLGVENVSVYDASLAEWATDPDLLLTTD